MNASATTLTGIGNAEPSINTRLHGAWLWVARAVWVAIALLAVVTYAAAAPVAFNLLRTPCDVEPCAPIQPTSEELRAFQEKWGLSPEFGAWYHTLLEAANQLVNLSVALLIFWRRSDEWTALITSFMLVTIFAVFSPSPMLLANAQSLWHGPLVLLRVIALTSTVSLFYLFPDGRFVPRWTRWLAIAVLVIIGTQAAVGAPFQSGFPVFIIALASGAGVQIYRYRRVSDRLQRQQTKWVVLGIAGMVVPMFLFLVFAFLNPLLNPLRNPAQISAQGSALFSAMITVCVVLPLTFFPVTLAISILRYRLWDVDIVLNRTLVYGVLTASVVAIYVAMVTGLGALFQSQGNLLISLLATGFVAVLFQPMRERVQRAINHFMYGERDEPYDVLTRLGQRLEAAIEPTSALPLTVETVAQALKLPYVAVRLNHNGAVQVAAVYGISQNVLTRLSLIYAGEPIGELVVASRAPNESLTPADQQLLSDLARQIGVAAHATLLAADLEQARLRIVAAREEARRRLGSDLHDGVGHQLAGLARQVETAIHLLDHEPETARESFTEITQQLNAAIAQVRGLAHQLHPPELELLGFIGVLREHAQTHPSLMIHLDAPDSLPPLPTAVETAAYYISLEALTNIEKHAGARSCSIRVALIHGEAAFDLSMLELDIIDDGHGLPPALTSGLGLLSMRARAAEVGGVCRVESNPHRGTKVRVRLPCSVQLSRDVEVVEI